ncbi:ABC transporter permease [Agrobacterium sp. SUL3]|uniref:ABC transporter permease n=1 Tax=Agrobacterium sp. SUL3 TaxID=1701910 RepID=UPI000A5E8A7B|nr:ABC transporter permease [Agrobacterium sp. SUL3]
MSLVGSSQSLSHSMSPLVKTEKAQAARVRRARRTQVLERLAAPALATVLLLSWELVSRYTGISDFILPRPSAILARMLADHRLLLTHAGTTAAEVLGGFTLAVFAGIAIALAVFYSRIVEVALYPILIAFQTVPKVALAPLIVLYFGYGWGPKLFLSFFISFFAIVVATVVGLQCLDRGYAYLARAMGASELQIFLKIRLPAALPNIFGSLKVALTLAVIGAVLGEYVAAERGLGYIQLQANANFDTTLNFAAVVSIALLGVGLYTMLLLAERTLVAKRVSSR